MLTFNLADKIVEHSHGVALADLGKDHGFRDLEALRRLGLADPVRHDHLSGPRAPRILAPGNGQDDSVLHKKCRHLGIRRLTPRGVDV